VNGPLILSASNSRVYLSAALYVTGAIIVPEKVANPSGTLFLSSSNGVYIFGDNNNTPGTTMTLQYNVASNGNSRIVANSKISVQANNSVFVFGPSNGTLDISDNASGISAKVVASKSHLILSSSLSGSVIAISGTLQGQRVGVFAKTSSPYTVVLDDSAKVLTNTGGGATKIIYNLPLAFTGAQFNACVTDSGGVQWQASGTDVIVGVNSSTGATLVSAASGTATSTVSGAFSTVTCVKNGSWTITGNGTFGPSAATWIVA